ncbi:unnamed protein product [Mytilus edulis]|uniref:Uncharacterized protein n=1 Tax=Mytilus edulis TaxID=6550 RepID=A0A8S3PWL1_MYTED|nr:unnamed protein product [Mytilus edulis]
MKVLELKYGMFYNYQKASKSFKFTNVQFTKVKHIKLLREKPSHVYVKYSFSEKEFQEISVLGQIGKIEKLLKVTRLSKKPVVSKENVADIKKWCVVQFDSDQEFGSPLQPYQIEDGQSSETGDDRRFEVGDQVEAPWIDGILYPGKIEFESEKKEDCLKYEHDKQSKKKVQKRKKKDQNGEDEERPAADSLKKRKK